MTEFLRFLYIFILIAEIFFCRLVFNTHNSREEIKAIENDVITLGNLVMRHEQKFAEIDKRRKK